MRARAHQADNQPNWRSSERVGPLQCYSWGRRPRRGRKREADRELVHPPPRRHCPFLCNSASREKCLCKVKHTRRDRFFPSTLAGADTATAAVRGGPPFLPPPFGVRLAGASNDRGERRSSPVEGKMRHRRIPILFVRPPSDCGYGAGGPSLCLNAVPISSLLLFCLLSR